ncbi:MAG: sortase, partial [Anaerolineae bacterium]|nr:sortase [Anaerolineae bacterium]
MPASSRPLGIAGDLLSILGLLMMAFSGIVLWQEGPTALLVTLNPNPASYERRVGTASRPIAPDRAALLRELYPTPTPPTPPTATPAALAAPEATLDLPPGAPTLAAPIPRAPLPTPTPAPGSEPPVRVLIPSIGVDSQVVQVGLNIVDHNGVLSREWETADYAAGHHDGSVNPGQLGNVVISGHNNVQGRVFRLLERIKPDDQVILETATGQRYRYIVREQVIVPETGVNEARRRENAEYMAQTDDARLTLITCWPYWTNTHRVIVVA